MKGLFWGTSGPEAADIVIVGESWGTEEQAAQQPFIGTSGTELNRMLAEAGIQRADVLCTNVIPMKPPGNEMWRFFHPADAPSGMPLIGKLDPNLDIRNELGRLYAQIATHPRKLVIAVGAYATWALTDCMGASKIRESNNRLIPKAEQRLGPTGIMNWRGSMWFTLNDPIDRNRGYSTTKLLPLIHPAAIMRQWSLRSVTVHDLKARVRMALNNDWRHSYTPVFYAPPTHEQCVTRLRMWLAQADSGTGKVRLSEDIETARGFITCLGLSDSTNFAMSIPFIRILDDRSFGSWWTVEQEAEIVGLLHRINAHPNILIEGQYFIYDTSYIQHWLASTPRIDWDSNIAQNVLFPGTPKDLAYLSSLYCKYHWFWKEDHKEWDMKGRIEDLLVYNCWDCVRTFEVCSAQRDVMAKSNMTTQMELKLRVHNDLCVPMSTRGIAVDVKRRGAVSMELEAASAAIGQELLQIIPQDLVSPGNPKEWYRSPKQTAYLMYDRLGFRVQNSRSTGNPSVGKEARNELKKRYPEFGGLFERLRLFGSVENSHGVVNATLDSDSRLRCAFNPGGPETHRLSSSKTPRGTGMNLQNLTQGEEDE